MGRGSVTSRERSSTSSQNESSVPIARPANPSRFYPARCSASSGRRTRAQWEMPRRRDELGASRVAACASCARQRVSKYGVGTGELIASARVVIVLTRVTDFYYGSRLRLRVLLRTASPRCTTAARAVWGATIVRRDDCRPVLVSATLDGPNAVQAPDCCERQREARCDPQVRSFERGHARHLYP
jgi:hypothetical protein